MAVKDRSRFAPALSLETSPDRAFPRRHTTPGHQTMRIATWNVNSIKQRIENLTAWLKEREPDIVCLQETKCIDEAFPREPIEALGYNLAVHGQKTFNGVAILSKRKFDE